MSRIREDIRGFNQIENPVNQPSRMSARINVGAQKAYDSWARLGSPKNFFDKVRLRLYYLNKYEEIYSFIKGFSDGDSLKTVDDLFGVLDEVFKEIALNNILLAYAYVTERDKENIIITKEDLRLLYMKRFYLGEITREVFNDAFGHYALNAFELASQRFKEYPQGGLKKVCEFLKEFSCHKSTTLEEAMAQRKKPLYAIYSTLREELKCRALSVVCVLRFRLLEIGKEKNIDNIFDMDYHEISG